MANFAKKSFPLGWIPSDNDYNGREDGLLRMDNCMLDDFGIVRNFRGPLEQSVQDFGIVPNLFSRIFNMADLIDSSYPPDAKLRYVHDFTANIIYRNYGPIGKSLTDFELPVLIGTNKASSAFLAALGHVFMTHSEKKVKDRGNIQEPLGIPAPALAPVTTQGTPPTVAVDSKNAGNYTNWDNAAVEGSGYSKAGTFLQITSDGTTKRGIVQLGLSTPTTIDSTNFGSGTGKETPSDIFQINLRVADSSQLIKVRVEFLLEAPTAPSTTIDIQNYFWYEWNIQLPTNVATQVDDPNQFLFSDTPGFQEYMKSNYVPNIQMDSTFRIGANVWTPLQVTRGQFNRVGSDDSKDWNAIKGVRITFTSIDTVECLFNDLLFIGGEDVLNGTYSYIQVDVNNTGYYNEFSLSGPTSAELTVINAPINVTPSQVNSQANECWIFRASNNVGGYLLINKQTGVKGFTPAPFVDDITDIEAQRQNTTLGGVQLEEFRTALPDNIIDMIYFNDRVMYLTPFGLFPSYKLDPGSYDSQFSYEFASGQSERCLFIEKVTEGQFFIGTSADIYSVTGSFNITTVQQTRFQDVTITPMGTKFPPISKAKFSESGTLFYMASDGWRGLSGTSNQNIVNNLSLLYNGYSRYGLGSVRKDPTPGNVLVSTAFSNGRRIFASESLTTGRSFYIFDSVTNSWNYWQQDPVDNSKNPVTVFAEEDGTVICAGEIGKLKVWDADETFAQQIHLLTPRYDFGLAPNRKDINAFNIFLDTGGVALNLSVNGLVFPTVTGFGFTQITLDAELVTLSKNFQIEITGITPTFKFYGFSFEYQARPTPTKRVSIPATNFDDPRKKRGRTWPFRIDGLGSSVQVSSNADGIGQGTRTIPASNYPATREYFYNSDVFAKDYSLEIVGENEFEFYQVYPLEIVEILPIEKLWDQIGPIEGYKIGDLKSFKLRLLPYGTRIDYRLFNHDELIYSGSFTVAPNEHQYYEILIPQELSAVTVTRVEFNSSLSFHRTGAWFKIRVIGKETEFQYVEVGQ